MAFFCQEDLYFLDSRGLGDVSFAEGGGIMGVKLLSSKGGIWPPAIERIRAAVTFPAVPSSPPISFLGARRRDESCRFADDGPSAKKEGLSNDQ
jgi:hypothetical protein